MASWKKLGEQRQRLLQSINETYKDAAYANEEIEKLKRRQDYITGQILEWKHKCLKLSQEIKLEEQYNLEKEEKIMKRLPVVGGLRNEKERLLKRINDVERTIMVHDDEILNLQCRGLGEGEDRKEFMKQLEKSRESASKKEALVKALKDEKNQVQNVLHIANHRVAGCIQNLRQVNDMIVDMSYGNYRNAMLKGKGKYSNAKTN